MFKPDPLRGRVIEWAHTIPATGRPRLQRAVVAKPQDGHGTSSLLLFCEFPEKYLPVNYYPFSSLPTAWLVAEALFQSVFRHYGILEETLSTRGPHFISRVWVVLFRKSVGVCGQPDLGLSPRVQRSGSTVRLPGPWLISPGLVP